MPGPTDAGGSDLRGKSPYSRRRAPDGSSRPAKVVGKDGSDRDRAKDEEETTDKLAVIDRTLAKVMKTLDAIDQSQDNQESVSRTKNSKDEQGQKSTTGATMTVPILVKSSSTREEHPGEVSSFASFSRKEEEEEVCNFTEVRQPGKVAGSGRRLTTPTCEVIPSRPTVQQRSNSVSQFKSDPVRFGSTEERRVDVHDPSVQVRGIEPCHPRRYARRTERSASCCSFPVSVHVSVLAASLL